MHTHTMLFICRWINLEGGQMYKFVSQDEIFALVTSLVAIGRTIVSVERI